MTYGMKPTEVADQWRELAKQDNVLNLMVPSDIRGLVNAITQARQEGAEDMRERAASKCLDFQIKAWAAVQIGDKDQKHASNELKLVAAFIRSLPLSEET